MLYRHPASLSNVTTTIKSIDFPDVNAEAFVDKELVDCEEYLEEGPEEVEKEFGTLGDDQHEMNDIWFMINVSV